MAVIGSISSARSIRRHLFAAATVSALLLGGVGGWAGTTSLAGAVIASGTFVVESNVKVIQHPTGGIVGEILVREGDRVEQGEVLLRLDDTQTRANLGIVTNRLRELSTRLARLVAERDDMPEIAFSRALLGQSDNPSVAAAINSERRLFESRKENRESKKAQLRERIAQYEHEVAGLRAQEVSFDRGLAIVDAEIASLRSLYQQGIVSVQRLNSLERDAALMGGERGEAIAKQAQARGRIAETRLQILQIDSDLKAEVGRELREIQAQIGEFVERRVAAEDQLKRIDIVAPQAGVVQQLTAHTVGGVISPADQIMLIVPDGDELKVEAQVSPSDIDQVHLGQLVVLRLSAFSRSTPELKGEVVRIAADRTIDERSGLSWYQVRVSVSADERARLGDLTLVPGMPAEAFIQTAKRTALSYLVKPISDNFNRAFREQ